MLVVKNVIKDTGTTVFVSFKKNPFKIEGLINNYKSLLSKLKKTHLKALSNSTNYFVLPFSFHFYNQIYILYWFNLIQQVGGWFGKS